VKNQRITTGLESNASRLAGLIQRLPAWVRLTAGIVLVIAAGILDYLVGYELSMALFYLLPIGLGVWFVSRRYGAALSALSAALCALGDLAAGVHYSRPLIPVWNACRRPWLWRADERRPYVSTP
jgi:hypothetical protein